jgi:hypothetical protein
VDDLEFDLEFFSFLVETFNFWVAGKFGRDVQSDKELGQVGSLL